MEQADLVMSEQKKQEGVSGGRGYPNFQQNRGHELEEKLHENNPHRPLQLTQLAGARVLTRVDHELHLEVQDLVDRLRGRLPANAHQLFLWLLDDLFYRDVELRV